MTCALRSEVSLSTGIVAYRNPLDFYRIMGASNTGLVSVRLNIDQKDIITPELLKQQF